jgi:prepilin-type processing-associated H-X9-DG protein
LGCHNYHALHKCFPPANCRWSYGTGKKADSNGKSTFRNLVYTLPYIEQQGIYDQLRFDRSCAEGSPDPSLPTYNPNLVHAGTLVSGFSCPTDPSSTERITTGRRHANEFMSVAPATTPCSYLTSGQVNYCPDLSWNGYCSKTSGEGFQPNDWYTHPMLVRKDFEITDGLSNTLAFGEMVPDCYNWTSWIYGDSSETSASNGINVHPIEGSCCRSMGANWNECQHCWSFRSLHPGGMNGSMADGSVHWINETIDMDLFMSLATIDGGEVVSVPD